MPNAIQSVHPFVMAAPQLFQVTYPAAAGTAGPVISILQHMQVGLQSRSGPSPTPYSGAWVEINNDSDSGLLCEFDVGTSMTVVPGQARSMPVPIGATAIKTTILYQNPYQVHPAQALMINFFSPVDIASGHEPLQGAINPSSPAAAIGPGPLPVGVSIGSGPESTTAQFIGLKPTVTESGVFDSAPGRATIVKAFASIFLGVNNYFDGTTDRYISSNPAYQLNFSRTAGWQFRLSTDVTPTAGNAITWSAFIPLVDTSGNRYADAAFVQAGALPAGVTLPAAQLTAGALPEGVTIGADDVGASGPNETFGAAAFLNPGQINSGALPAGVTLPGSQVTGDLAASQIGPGNLDTDVVLTGSIASLGGQTAAGSFGAPVIVAQSLHNNVTSTAAIGPTLITVPATGLYRVSAYVHWSNGSNSALQCSLGWFDPDGGGTSASFLSNNVATGAAPLLLDGSHTLTAGTILFILQPQVVYAASGTVIKFDFQDPSGTPNDFWTAVVERLA